MATLWARWRTLLAVSVLALALLWAIIGLAHPRGGFHPWHSLFGPKEDGSWAALSIDGHKVSPDHFRVTLYDRRVVGGRDGCNDWAYTSEPDASGERMIQSTLQLCPGTELRRVYHVLAYHSEARVLPDGKLQLAASRHRAIFARCRWMDVHESGPGWTSNVTKCVID